MIFINKKIGETPLQLIDRIRVEQPQFKNEKMSYAGRLDPMAEGQMLILVGDENQNRDKYMGFDKEYVATFLIGVSTDTGDILGITNSTELLDTKIDEQILKQEIIKLTGIKTQKYPWFSGKTVFGIKLFDHFRRGNTDIERPTQIVDIKKVELIEIKSNSTAEIKDYIYKSIGSVSGDFRQEEILAKWESFFQIAEKNPTPINSFSIKITVSSGTFIRALTENFSFPTVLLKLNRTKIFTNFSIAKTIKKC
ncbi:MAG TPA: hypothetical protein PKA60_00515 [Candidatus Paceibacterota bacterium]|nr:hypothetical protein [Candidatus Paceibacterota bacterium]